MANTAKDSPTDGGVPIEDKVRFLGSPAAYAQASAVQVRETHMAWVFLTRREAYKLKKPVKYPFLDFGTIDARKADCLDELRLNRRLAPDVYLGLVALTMRPDGGLALGGPGRIVDWLVRMRRLPEERMLANVLAREELAPGDVERLGTLLARFYRGARPAAMSPDVYLDRFRSQHALNLMLFRRFASALDGPGLDEVTGRVGAFLGSEGRTLADRARQGHVVEGHADLRPQHVFLTCPPVVIDCLEFNEYLRLVDPFDDIAFLGLECERLGAGWAGGILREMLAAGLGDRPTERLFSFYTVFRACLQARLALAHLAEPGERPAGQWTSRARDCLDAARLRCRRLFLP